MKLVAFTLFGLDPIYAAGAVANARLARQHYPDWTCRFYIGDSITDEVAVELARLGAQVVRMTGRREDWSALLWRFNALTDSSLDAVIFRDCDSRLDAREAAAVQEWLASGADFHIMRDHPEHYLPILAGLWGATGRGAARIANLRPSNLPSQHRFVDQEWLRETVYPVVVTSMYVHDEFGHVPGEPAHPFQLPRQPLDAGAGWAFAGQGYDADGAPRWPEHAHSVEPRHEWRLFDEGTVPEHTTPGWYTGRDHAPHLEEGHRPRMLAAATLVAQAAFTHGLRTVVDLGSGDGGLLSLIGPGLKAWGYDLTPANVEAAKHRDVDVRYGDVLADPVEWADIAVCTEMLEHLVDPHTFLRTVLANCRAVVASSPRDERPGHAYEFHTWAWDFDGYRMLFEQAGWKVQRQRSVDRFQVILGVRP